MISANKMWRTGIWVFTVPICISAVCRGLIWLIPDCNPNPYSLNGCLIAGYGMGPTLVFGFLGGIYVAVAGGLFVSLPLFVISMVMKRREQNSSVR